MGKDGDKRDQGKPQISKEDLADEHSRLVQRDKELTEHLQDVQAIFQKLDTAYQTSKGTFSVQRYGQLKDMIKGATSETTISSIQKMVDGPANKGDAGKGGMVSLMQKAKEFSSETQAQEQSSQTTASSKPKGKMSSFVKRLKNITGFSDEPVRDEDVMSESELQRDNARKQRAIQQRINHLSKALKALEKLRHSYEASKAHAPPKRYQELKEMIKETVADKSLL